MRKRIVEGKLDRMPTTVKGNDIVYYIRIAQERRNRLLLETDVKMYIYKLKPRMHVSINFSKGCKANTVWN